MVQTRLPEGARVGTADKFQGQEAALVLISMATSSGDDLVRGGAGSGITAQFIIQPPIAIAAEIVKFASKLPNKSHLGDRSYTSARPQPTCREKPRTPRPHATLIAHRDRAKPRLTLCLPMIR